MDRERRAAFRQSSIRACGQKEQHPTWSSARRACVRAKRQGWDHMEPYHCPGCGRYHVGHPPGPDADYEV